MADHARPGPGPVPEQARLRGTGFPWAINEAKGVSYHYDPRQFPVAQMLCDSYTIVHGIHAQTAESSWTKSIAAFHKVFANLDAAIAHADDPIYPGADGALYGVG